MSHSVATQNWGRTNIRERAIDAFSREGFTKAAKDAASKDAHFLPYGNGRTYGDSCHNDDGLLLDSRGQNRILDLDLIHGWVRAESGLLLIDLLSRLSRSGWFVPVVPGTKFVTLGGMIGNDIHGKNHFHDGSIGNHVRKLALLRSDGEEVICSRDENADLFSATIGGMGLTGYILWAELDLMKAPSHLIMEEKVSFQSLDEILALTDEAERSNQYSVAWIDSLAGGAKLGRGILITGNHASREQSQDADPRYGKPIVSVPVTPPVALVAGLPLRAFNEAYFWANGRKSGIHLAQPDSFFFPLDAVGAWNRLYGPYGLHQHQCALPLEAAPDAIRAMLEISQKAHQGSFLTVLKRFGEVPSPGLLSFPVPGYTLTLDFANKGTKTLELLGALDRIVLDAGGRVNPYKDSRMSAEVFRAGFANWRELEALRDPAMMSDFWRRVSQ